MKQNNKLIKDLKKKLNNTDMPELKKALRLKIKSLESGNTVCK